MGAADDDFYEVLIDLVMVVIAGIRGRFKSDLYSQDLAKFLDRQLNPAIYGRDFLMQEI